MVNIAYKGTFDFEKVWRKINIGGLLCDLKFYTGNREKNMQWT